MRRMTRRRGGRTTTSNAQTVLPWAKGPVGKKTTHMDEIDSAIFNDLSDDRSLLSLQQWWNDEREHGSWADVPATSAHQNTARLEYQQRAISKLLESTGAIERECDYVLPSGLHCDTHINFAKVCASEPVLQSLAGVLERAISGIDFDTIVSTGWTMATVARRLLRRPAFVGQRRLRHVLVEGYRPAQLLGPIPQGARAIVLMDVLATGGLLTQLNSVVRKHGGQIAKAVALVHSEDSRPESCAYEGLCRIPMRMCVASECDRCDRLPRVEFNPVAYRMTRRNSIARSPSAFLAADSCAREFWELVEAADAYEHHRREGGRHYLGFVDTARMLNHADVGAALVQRLAILARARGGMPDVILAPARLRAVLLARRMVDAMVREGLARIEVLPVRRSSRTGRWTLKPSTDLSGRRVLLTDTAAGQGETLDDLSLLALEAGATRVGAAVLLSRLTEGNEEALDRRLAGGFVRLYSFPLRPIAVSNGAGCPACRQQDELKLAAERTQLPALRQLQRARSSMGSAKRESRSVQTSLPGFLPSRLLERCHRKVASGIALHTISAAMGDGMPSLSLPEISDKRIPHANRAAILERLPDGILEWSGPELTAEITRSLHVVAEDDVWTAAVNLLARERSNAWLSCLESRLRTQAQDKAPRVLYWSNLVYAAYRVGVSNPDAAAALRKSLADLMGLYAGTNVSPRLRQMLDASTPLATTGFRDR